MNPVEAIILWLQQAMAQVPDIVQPLLVALAGMIPFVEGEIASMLGVWAGVHPVVAFLAAAVGNFLSVFVVVFFGARIRAAVVARRARRNGGVVAPEKKPESKGRLRLKKFLVRFGVPGASILGPLAMPTQFTSAILVSSGVAKQWVLLWQAVAIVIWTAVCTVSATLALTLIVG